MSDAAVLVDAACIGTGQAVPALATALSARRESVVVFERGLVGGSCVNVGCTPTKALRKTARVAHLARRAGEFGVRVGDVQVDVPAAMARVRAIVEGSRQGLEQWLGGAETVELVRAHARLDGREGERLVVRAGDRTWHAARVYLNTGTRPVIPPIPGLGDVAPLTNESILALTEAPKHLLILGGSYIGLEFAQIFRRLGSEVTVLETSHTIAAREDDDVSARLTEMLTAEGVVIETDVHVDHVSRSADAVISLTIAGRAAPVQGTALLVATGRQPNTDALGLETLGIHTDAQGYIPVDDALSTSAPGVWALGDVNRRGAFTHTSWQDHDIVLANHAGGARSVAGRVPTYAMYTDPPLGRIGMNVRDARTAMEATGRRFLVATQPMARVSRAKEEGETIGIITVIVDAKSHRFAGISMLGIGADEIVQTIGALMAADAPYEVLRDVLPVHPTVSEFFPTMLGRLEPLGQEA